MNKQQEGLNTIYCDVLVIGGGAAGSRAALEAKQASPELDVLVVVDSGYDTGGSTNMIASEALGINAPFNYEGDGDSVDIYEQDTVTTGGGLANPELCRIIAEESSARVQELMDLGLEFTQRDGHIEQQKLSGCTKARSLTCYGSTGRAMTGVMKRKAQALGVQIAENLKITRLHHNEQGVVCGAFGTKNGQAVFVSAKAVVLATGGASAMFSFHVASPTQTGDGWAMAYDAGCQFVNMESFQCGPAVVKPGFTFIIHSHMWRLLPKLTNASGEVFLPRYCKDGVTAETALDLKAMSYPFSVRTDAKYVDIAIFDEVRKGNGTKNGGVYFDVTHVPKDVLLEKAPVTYETLLKAGIDIAVEPLELGIGVQNFNGGILIDKDGFTGVEGLWAAGEITGGVHGSDRPGGNNLTDTQVFGYRAGRAAAAYAATHPRTGEERASEILETEPDEAELAIIRESERLYYQYMTVIRSQEGLEKVLAFIEAQEKTAKSSQLKNRLTVGRLMAQALLARKESRGTHYREDYPATEEAWRRRIVLQKGADGLPVEV